MSVVATSVFLLFALIFLGFFIGKRGIVKKESIPDLSNLVIMVTMPVTVFRSIVDQRGLESMGSGIATIMISQAIILTVSALIALICVKLFKVPDQEKGVWIFTCMLSNNGFMGLPLALSVYGSKGLFMMALGNVVNNFIIFSVGIKLLTMYFDTDEKINIRKMLVNNINIAVVIGFIFFFTNLPVPELVDRLLAYLANITSGLSMLVVGLSLSRMALNEVFKDKKMLLLAAVRLLVIPAIIIGMLHFIPVDPVIKSVLILTAALPAASSQSMITEQYGTNTTAAGRAVFITTLFSLITVPLVMIFGL